MDLPRRAPEVRWEGSMPGGERILCLGVGRWMDGSRLGLGLGLGLEGDGCYVGWMRGWMGGN